jgi:hypothetical protein
VDPWLVQDVEIDPRLLFETVGISGGFYEVTQQQAWPLVAEKLLPQYQQLLSIGDDGLAARQAEEELKQMYWTRLYALERVLLFGESDLGIDYAQQGYESTLDTSPMHMEMDSTTDKSNLSNTNPNPPEVTSSYVKREGYEDEDDEEGEEDSEDELSEEMEDQDNQTNASLAADSDRAKRKVLTKVKLNPKALMELFTTRPEQGRPLTWRHHLEPPTEKIAVEDFTKTIVPPTSKRLTARNREGMLIHRLERALINAMSSNNLSGTECVAALKTLTTRTYGKSFFISLYPMLLERLLKYTKSILNRLSLLRGSFAPLFNLPGDDRDTDLSQLVRISTILRNLAYGPHNVNLMASHPTIIALLSDFVSLDPILPQVIAHQYASARSTLSEVKNLVEASNHWNTGNPLAATSAASTQVHTPHTRTPTTPSHLKTTHMASALADAPVDSTISPISIMDSAPSSLPAATSLILQLKSDFSASHLIDIQFNAMEALSRIVTYIRFKPLDERSQDDQEYQDLSQTGRDIMRCLPILAQTAVSTSSKSSTVFLAVELLAKISMNSNSRPMWKILDCDHTVALMSNLIRFALLDDELSDWSMLAALHISLNALNLPMAQTLCKNICVIEDLMLLCSAFNNIPKTGPTETLQNLAFRRHTLAQRAAVILHKLVEFVPLKEVLLKYESIIADVYSNAPSEIADPLYRVFLEMQT